MSLMVHEELPLVGAWQRPVEKRFAVARAIVAVVGLAVTAFTVRNGAETTNAARPLAQ